MRLHGEDVIDAGRDDRRDAVLARLILLANSFSVIHLASLNTKSGQQLITLVLLSAKGYMAHSAVLLPSILFRMVILAAAKFHGVLERLSESLCICSVVNNERTPPSLGLYVCSILDNVSLRSRCLAMLQ